MKKTKEERQIDLDFLAGIPDVEISDKEKKTWFYLKLTNVGRIGFCFSKKANFLFCWHFGDWSYIDKSKAFDLLNEAQQEYIIFNLDTYQDLF